MTDEAQISNEAEAVVVDPVTPEAVLYDKAAKDAAVKAEEVKQEEAKTEVVKEETQEVDGAKKEDQSHDLDISAPENSQLTEKDIEQVKTYAKENNLSKEAAQKLVDEKNSLIVQYQSRQADQLKTQTAQWLKQAEVDAEIGGKDFNANIENAKRVLEKYGTPGLRKALEQSGLGNSPDVIKTFFRISKLMQNDKLVVAPKNGASAEKTLEDIFYGKTS